MLVREYVERKREREDFVVDDDGLGYHDDGEYDIRSGNYGGEEEARGGEFTVLEGSWGFDARVVSRCSLTSFWFHFVGSGKKRGNGTAALTKEALRKARRNKALEKGGE